MPKRSPKHTPQQSVGNRDEPPRQLPSVSTSAVFSFLKDTRGALTWKMHDFQDCLNIGAKDAKQILAILQMQGYIQQKDDTDEFLTTASGEAGSGSKLPRMKRESVDEALSTITERIAAINRDPRAKCDGQAEKFYRDLKQRGIRVRVGLEATGYSRWFERLLAELGFELWSEILRRSKPSE
jgi:hypothetical protein